jgi:cardiolipin synthase
MIPAFFVLLIDGHNILATILFAIAASTDWIDGQIARRTNSVSKLGQLLDPTVDRLLMIVGVIGLFMVGRLPLWIIIIVIGRDLCMLIGGAYLLKRYRIKIAVIYAGKVVTTLLFVGFVGLLMGVPMTPAFDMCTFDWLPGFNGESVAWGIWFVYAGICFGIVTTGIYVSKALHALSIARQKKDC